MNLSRGQVWWAQMHGDSGFRPVVALSRSEGLARRMDVTVAEITTTIRSLPSEVELSERDGLAEACVGNTNNLQTISKHAIIEYVTTLSSERIFELERALRYSLDLEWDG